MDIQKCRAFVNVVEKKSLTLAAKEMGYSQPGISHMIDSLEREVGFPILVRSKYMTVPTPAGEELLYHCRQIVKNADQFEETVMAISGLLKGSITIGAYHTILKDYLPQLMAEFNNAYKNIAINVIEYPSPELNHSLISGESDMGFMCSPIPSGYEFFPLFDDYYCVIMNKNHPLAVYDRVPSNCLTAAAYSRRRTAGMK